MRIVFIMLLLIPSIVYSTNYYVKPTGNDGWAGTSEELAWEHVQKALTTLVAGDTCFIRSGYYNEPSAFTNYDGSKNAGYRPSNSGTVGNPIVFKGYPGDVRPILGGKPAANPFDTARGNRIGSDVSGRHYITFDSLEFRFGYAGIATVGCNYLTIKHCVIDSFCGTPGGTGTNNIGAVLTKGGDTTSSRWMTVYACSLFSIGDNGSYGPSWNASGIQLYHGGHLLFRKNVMRNVWAGVTVKGDQYGSTALFYDVLMDSNKFYDIEAWAACASLSGNASAPTDSVVIRFNTAAGCGNGFVPRTVGQGSYADRIWIYNNTIDGNGVKTGVQSQFNTNMNRFYLFNNIIHRPQVCGGGVEHYNGALGFKNETGNPTAAYIDYNLYKLNDTTSSLYFTWGSNDDYNYVAWKASNQTAEGLLSGQDSHSSVGDALFVNSTAPNMRDRDYHLQVGSPAASGGKGGAYPTYRGAFAPGGNSPPTTPTLNSPADGATDQSLTPTLVLNNSTDADADPITYSFEVYNSGHTIVYADTSGVTQGGGSTTSWVVPAGSLDYSTLYYWWARAYDGVNYSFWSLVRDFTTMSEPGEPEPDTGKVLMILK